MQNNNLKLTPEQRLSVYKEALTKLTDDCKSFFLCKILSHIVLGKWSDETEEIIKRLLPEFRKKKPFGADEAWWVFENHLDNIKKRREVLKQCIAEVEAIIQQSKTESHVR